MPIDCANEHENNSGIYYQRFSGRGNLPYVSLPGALHDSTDASNYSLATEQRSSGKSATDSKSSNPPASMNGRNGAPKKKEPRQRAVITITDRPDGKFDASLTFEPSIKQTVKQGNQKIIQIIPSKENNIAVQTAWHVWGQLKQAQKSTIIITDE